MSLKFTEEACLMAMENDAKFEEELNCRFKTDMKNLMDFENQSKIQRICTLTGSF